MLIIKYLKNVYNDCKLVSHIFEHLYLLFCKEKTHMIILFICIQKYIQEYIFINFIFLAT